LTLIQSITIIRINKTPISLTNIIFYLPKKIYNVTSLNPPSEFKKKRHRAGKITREYRDASRFRRIKRLELNSKHIFVKSEKKVFLPESFISALKAKAKFLFYLPENFISQKFYFTISSNSYLKHRI